MKNTALSYEDRLILQKANPDWQLNEDTTALSVRYQFTNFRRAFAFMTEVGMMAEKYDHHPEWFNVYGRVELKMTTHDHQGLSALDEKLVPVISAAARRFEAKIVKAD